tara:strand:- start:582 stop:752 length:171 start_codon:yes stop_codon:yes gene_type:complete
MNLENQMNLMFLLNLHYQHFLLNQTILLFLMIQMIQKNLHYLLNLMYQEHLVHLAY